MTDTATVIGAFYERHPYPPAVDDLEGYAAKWDDQRRRAEACLLWPSDPARQDRRILVAGCGTTQAAKVAVRWPQAQVTGIDLSAASIAFCEALKGKYGLGNLQLQQLPVERARELGQTFDTVICTGVLHHLPDPDAGLAALHDVMDDGGVLQLMVYAPYGRTGIYMIQDYCRRLGIAPTERELLDLLVTLKALPPDHPLTPVLARSRDLLTREGLADALLNPIDRAYSAPQLLAFLVKAGLQFGRWQRQAPYMAQCGAPAATPHGARLARLAPPEQAAALELLRGTMTRHSAIAYRGEAARVDFRGDAWRAYVPMRVPDTIAVRQNLPPGAAAVLINRTHTFTDIHLPIDAKQERMLAAVDGKRTLGEIGEGRAVREFFEQLWRYDQVVFDLSAAGSA